MSEFFQNEFAIINKSYIQDLKWTVALFRTWLRFSSRACPFYVIVPESDIKNFQDTFSSYVNSSQLEEMPYILSEEYIFEIAEIEIPDNFTGWEIQQIIKLCFSKTKIAANYLTVDSCIVFTREFDYDALMEDGQIFTSAQQVIKSEFFDQLQNSGEKGWLNGSLVNISNSFSAICDFMENGGVETNAYISCTGMFNSIMAMDLEKFAYGRGVAGYVGLIEIAPYEFAWYGEYIFSQRKGEFKPHSPYIMSLAHTEEHAQEVLKGKFVTQPHHYGIMFQPPASDICDPEWILHQLGL